MVETLIGYNNWLQEFQSFESHDDIILHVVCSNDDDHPVVSHPIILFVHSIKSKETFTFSFDHQDSTCPIPLDKVCADVESLKCRKWVLDRKSFIEILPISSVRDVNLLLFTETNKLIETQEFITSAHSLIARTHPSENINKIIPMMKHLESFDELCQSVSRAVNKYYGKTNQSSFDLFNFQIFDILKDLESNGVYVDPDKFGRHFKSKIYPGNLVYSQYNIFTATGRPSNRYGGINFSALNKEDGSRECFVSRHGKDGRLFLVDYSAFHPNLICHIVGYELPEGRNIYEYLGELYFKRKNLSNFDIDEAKKITFRQLYGGVEERYQYIKYFVHLKGYINGKWKEFQEQGFVLTPWFKRRIDNKHLKDANPNKLFNYILQASELEASASTIKKLNEYLQDKRSKPVLYTYDSLLFDIHADGSADVIPTIVDIMSLGGKLPVKSYIGNDYDTMKQVNI